jgi:hypothetical protein
MYVQHNIEARSCKHCCCGKSISIAHSECVFVALVIQHAKRMRHIVICGLSGCTIFFYIISLKAHFREKKKRKEKKEKKRLKVKCVFWCSVQLLCEICLIISRNDQYMIKNVYWSSRKVLVILSDCNETWIFVTDFRKILKYLFNENPSSRSRVVPCGRTDRGTDMTKLIVAFRNFANATKSRLHFYSKLELS